MIYNSKIIKKSRSVIAVVLSILVFASTFVSVSAVSLDINDTKASNVNRTHTDGYSYSVVKSTTKGYLSSGTSTISDITGTAVKQNGAGIYYTIETGTNTNGDTTYSATITGTTDNAGSNNSLTIPDEIAVWNGKTYLYYNVTKVNNGALDKLNNSLTNLKINKGIYSMSSDVVRNITTLKTISSDAKNNTFYTYDNILYKVISSRLDGFSYYFLEDVSVFAVPQNYQKTTLIIPSTVKYTSREVYKNQSNPTKVSNLPVSRLSQYSLSNLRNVTTIKLGANIRYISYHQMSDGTIGSGADSSIMSCNPKLQKFEVDSGNPYFVAGDNGKSLYSKTYTILYRYANNNSDTTFTCNRNTEVLAYGCFEDALNLQTINLNNSNASRVRYLGQAAFSNCANLNKITWSPQNYYYVKDDSGSYVKKSNLAEFVASSLNDGKVHKYNPTGYTSPTFSIGYSQLLLTKDSLYFGDTTTEKDIVNETQAKSNKNNVLRQALQLWYKPLYSYINDKVKVQNTKAKTVALTDEVKSIIDKQNKGFLDIDELNKDNKRLKNGTSNGSDTYLTKAGKWTNEEKTKAKVSINYTSGTTTGIDLQLQIDKTASMISTGSSNVKNPNMLTDERQNMGSVLITDFSQDTNCPSSRIYEQYSFVYNLAKGLTESNNDEVQNRVSVSAFLGSLGDEGYANVFADSTKSGSNHSYECGPNLSHKISDISNDLSYKELFSTSSTKLAQYLNSIDIENPTGVLGTSYYQATRCAIEIIKAKKKTSEKATQVILVSDGEPNNSSNTVELENEANISSKAKELRQLATVYTVLEGRFSATALEDARTAMGWVSGYNYNENNKQDYNKFNYSGSNQTALTKAFESIFDNIIEYKNTVIKDVVNNEQFNVDTSSNTVLEVDKANVLYDFTINYNPTTDNRALISNLIKCSDYKDGGYYINYTKPENIYVRSRATGIKYPISNEDTTANAQGYSFKFRVPVSEENSLFVFEGISKTDGSVISLVPMTSSGIRWNLTQKEFIKIVTGNISYGLTSTISDCVVATKKYIHHSFNLGKSKSGITKLANITCTECGKKFSDVFTNDNQGNSYAYFGSAKIGTTYRPTVELHIPNTDYTDVFNLTFDLNLKNKFFNTGGDYLTNFDGTSEGCFVYDETTNDIDNAMKGSYPNKTLDSVTPVNTVKTPELEREKPVLEIKAELYQEKYNYSNKEYSLPLSDESTTYVAKNSDSTEYTVTMTNGKFDFSTLPTFDTKTGKYASYTVTRKSTVPTRYTADKLTFTFTSEQVKEAVKSKKPLTVTFKDKLKKATLNIKKTAFDNEVENVYFKVTTPNINSVEYGTYENIVKTDSEGVATVNELPIYDVDNSFVTYKVEELGLLKEDGTYEIPFKYLEPASQEFTFKNGNTYTAVKTISFENKKRPTGNIEIIKTSEDEIIKDIAFMVTGTDGSKIIVTTNDSGKAYAKELFIADKEGNKFEYTVKEIGVLKEGKTVGSQNESDYELPIRYEKQQTQTVTLDDTPDKTVTVSFDNKLLKGTINVVKKDTSDKYLEGVGYVLFDDNKNVVPLELNSKNTASYKVGGRTDYTLYTDKNGKISIDKLPILDEGKYYYIKEVSTIDGYNLLSDYVKIDNLSYTNLEVTQTITNNPKYLLPMTGADWLSYLCILALAMGTGSFIYYQRKKVDNK